MFLLLGLNKLSVDGTMEDYSREKGLRRQKFSGNNYALSHTFLVLINIGGEMDVFA